jgi:hypothetical protein
MATKHYLPRIIALALAGAALGTGAHAQVNFDLTLIVSDAGNGAAPGLDTLHWGLNPNATGGKDESLGEEEQPPAPPEGVFDARWINVGSSANFGQGVKRNFHPLGESKRDTFRLKVQPAFKPSTNGYPMTITWPDLKNYFGSASLRFVDGDGEPQTMDMLTGTSFTFSNPSSVTSTITITTADPKDPSSGVESTSDVAGFTVTASPNPARRAAGVTITYTLPFEAMVTAKLYNVNGELVRTIEAGRRNASEHSLRINTSDLPSGSYYCTLVAGKAMATRSFVLAD